MNRPIIVDMSYWKDDKLFDYDLFAKSVDGVILRAAYGVWKDTRFDLHYRELFSRGVPMGAYHYIIGSKSAKEQANVFAETIDGLDLPMDLWCDVEDRRPITRLSRSLVVNYLNEADTLCRKDLDIYTSPYAWDEIMGIPLYMDRKLWIANYYVAIPSLPKCGGWKTWWMHQYTDIGKVPGFSRTLDLNQFNGSLLTYQEWVKCQPPGYTDKERLDILWNQYLNNH